MASSPDFRLVTHPDVYPPREDTDLLLTALPPPSALGGLRALEMGPGTGLVTLTLAAAGAQVVAVDVNPHACRTTRENARRHQVGDRVDVLRGDLWSPLRPGTQFDLIAFNPPYLPAEPEDRVEGWMDEALHGGGAGGVDVPLRFVQGLPAHLAPGGTALLLLSSQGNVEGVQAEVVRLGLTWREVAAARFFFERLTVMAIAR